MAKIQRIDKLRITKVTGGLTELRSGEEQQKVTLVLENGDRVTIRDDHPFFRNADMLKPGDVISFNYQTEYKFKPEDGDREYVYLTGGSDFEFELGTWTDKPDDVLVAAGRTSAKYTKSNYQAAPPVGGSNRQFTAPPKDGETGTAKKDF